MPLSVKRQSPGWFRARVGAAGAEVPGRCLAWRVGSGSDGAEEPVFRVSAGHAGFESSLGVLPDLVRCRAVEASMVGDELSVDDVAEASLQTAQRFFGALALGQLAGVVVGSGPGVADLDDGWS